MLTLFSENTRLPLPDAEISYHQNFFDKTTADFYFETLLKHIPWQQDDITVFGKTYAQPRLTALFGTNGKSYSYSDITMQPHNFDFGLTDIKTKIEQLANKRFTTCLANLYRNGKDSNGWHADDEKELGENPVIASVSFGHERYFHLRHKSDESQRHKIILHHGSLLLMQGPTQHFWQHQIAKTKKNIGPRINLTFRVIP